VEIFDPTRSFDILGITKAGFRYPLSTEMNPPLRPLFSAADKWIRALPNLALFQEAVDPRKHDSFGNLEPSSRNPFLQPAA
jgi:hypothetical protein